MKTFQLNKGTLELPTSMDELTLKQREYAFSLLFQLFAGSITPLQFKAILLIYLTGYKPAKTRQIHELFLFLFRRQKYEEYMELKAVREDNIQFNLVKLSEQIDLLFTVEDNKIIPDQAFPDNPFRSSFEYSSFFTRNITVETDITAKEFSDCLDLMMEADKHEAGEVRDHCTSKIASILLRIEMKEACMLSFGVRFGVMCWFQSIAYFFRNHPDYSILYNRTKKASDEDDDDKISLGMSETMLYLKKEGYAQSDDMNVIEFFNAQVKSLKDNLLAAISSGMEIDKLSDKTGLSITDINRLI